jgi:aspartyl-tRNA(Asn)/glutamyl-tRNA(Gln) amidotransferase subunit A
VISEDALFSGIRELGAQLRARKFSAVELAELSLRRLETLGPKLGALVSLTRERAMSEAHRANQELFSGKDRGPLHGIPYGLKDLVAAKGAPTSWGALPLRDQVLDADATIVTRLEQAGAVLVGKLAMVELAGGLGYNNPDASFTGPGRTPWNPQYWSGGSSSGSGASVAAGLVPFAIGSETSGSILTPSAFCGVTGLRPSYGLVSRHGAMTVAWTLDKLGPIARSVDDCAIVLATIAGPDPRDATTSGDAFRHKPPPSRPPRRFRVGVIRNATLDCDPDVEAGFRQAVAALHELADVESDVAFPDQPYADAVRLVVSAECAAAQRELIESGRVKQLQDRADRVRGFARLMTPAVDYIDAMRARVAMRAELDALLARYDALVAPTRTRLAPKLGQDFDAPTPGSPPQPEPQPGAPRPPATIAAGNLAGLPALALPMGFAADGRPVSLQLLGRAFGEATLIALGIAYQQTTDWHRKRPAL